MNDPQVMQMQREAERRVQRMAERSRRLVREQPVHVYRGTTVSPCAPCERPPRREAVAEPPTVQETDAVCEPTPCSCEPTPCERESTLCCSTAESSDSEGLLLLLLVFVLWRNHAPLELLLALLYIAL